MPITYGMRRQNQYSMHIRTCFLTSGMMRPNSYRIVFSSILFSLRKKKSRISAYNQGNSTFCILFPFNLTYHILYLKSCFHLLFVCFHRMSVCFLLLMPFCSSISVPQKYAILFLYYASHYCCDVATFFLTFSNSSRCSRRRSSQSITSKATRSVLLVHVRLKCSAPLPVMAML